jgi:[glutamine synthetase] adenylyltransferase / [glutamine synthetase]-adenylyl-L-tyrosine phosphorylase
VPDETEDRSTVTTLARLRAAGSLREEDFRALSEGYALLRTLDHSLRLLVGRSTRLPAADHTALEDLARCTGFDSASALTRELDAHMKAIREAYDRITTEIT